MQSRREVFHAKPQSRKEDSGTSAFVPQSRDYGVPGKAEIKHHIKYQTSQNDHAPDVIAGFLNLIQGRVDLRGVKIN